MPRAVKGSSSNDFRCAGIGPFSVLLFPSFPPCPGAKIVYQPVGGRAFSRGRARSILYLIHRP